MQGGEKVSVIKGAEQACPECGSFEFILDIVDFDERAVYLICKKCNQQWSIGPA